MSGLSGPDTAPVSEKRSFESSFRVYEARAKRATGGGGLGGLAPQEEGIRPKSRNWLGANMRSFRTSGVIYCYS
jgi:hypothetical protein